MPRPSSDFATLNTGSQPKLDVIDKQIAIVNRLFPEDMDGYCVGIPGAGLQASRHAREYRSYGVADERQVMVDYDPEVHATQVEYMQKEDYKGKIVHGELSQEVHKLWSEGKTVDVIDYDDVGFLQPRHEQMIRDAAEHGVKVVILVVTNRCRKLSSYQAAWKKKLGLEARVTRPSRIKPSEPVGDIHMGAVRAIASEVGYNVEIMPYPGRDIGPPMMSCVLTKN